MQQKINYIGLLLLIILGVALGNLTSSWVTAKYNYVEPEIKTITAPKVLSKTLIKGGKPSELKEPAKTGTPEPSEVIRETVKLSPNSQTETEEIKPIADPKQLMDQRKIDENGIRLAKQCNEWTIVHKDMNTQSSERGMSKHCAEYYDYLSFGNLPSSN